MASSSDSRRYEVFPSFCGEDVRKSFLSHLLKELDRKCIKTFKDHGIERSRPIAPELISAIRESRISIIIFSENYASSTWCLNELVEIHKCFKELGQMVIPVFYKVDPSDVRKQTGKFGEAFTRACEGKSDDQKQRWIEALAKVASIAGEHSENLRDEAEMIEKISRDVSDKLITPSSDFGDFVGIEAHLESLKSKLCLEVEDARMVGIVGTSGIGKTTIARALYSQLSSQFHYRVFRAYKRTIHNIYEMKLAWEQQFLSEILCEKDLKLEQIGEVKRRLKNMKVLIVLDDVEDVELLKTLVEKPDWFGNGSRIIVISQNSQLLKSHNIDLVYEVEFPSEDTALKMLCRSAFGQDSPPDGFMELAVEVSKLAGNLPLGLTVLGSSLRGRGKEEWVKMVPMLRNNLKVEIGKILKVCYDRLESEDDQELFLYIACLLNGESVSYINDLLESVYTSVKTRITMLADKSLIRMTAPEETVQMHTLLQKLGMEIVRAESRNDPGKRRFLVDLEDIREVLTNKTGTENVLGICLNLSYIQRNILEIDESSFEGMRNLQFIKFYGNFWLTDYAEDVKLKSPRGLINLPPKLRLLHWYGYPGKYIPSDFKADYLVELVMKRSKLNRLWEGTLPLQHLKKMDLECSRDLKKIPNLSKAKKLKVLNLHLCEELMVLPEEVKFESLEHLHLNQLSLSETNIASLWIENIHRVTHLSLIGFPLRSMPSNFRTEHLVALHLEDSRLEKLWEGVQPLENLVIMDLSWSNNLKEIPDLSKATKLKKLIMMYCPSLEGLPTDVNLESLEELNLSGCSRLRSFPQISTSIEKLNLASTAIEEVPSWIENMSELQELQMKLCRRLKNISPSIFKLRHLKKANFRLCHELTSFSDASGVATAARITDSLDFPSNNFDFDDCFNLDRNAQELILSMPIIAILPGGEVPTYFTHRTCGNSLNITLPQSSPSHEVLRFKACTVVRSGRYINEPIIKVRWRFRGLNGVKSFDLEDMDTGDHVVVFYFELNSHISAFRSAAIEHKSRQCELVYNDIEFEFLLINEDEFEFLHIGERGKGEIKGCGIRLQDAESGRSKRSRCRSSYRTMYLSSKIRKIKRYQSSKRMSKD